MISSTEQIPERKPMVGHLASRQVSHWTLLARTSMGRLAMFSSPQPLIKASTARTRHTDQKVVVPGVSPLRTKRDSLDVERSVQLAAQYSCGSKRSRVAGLYARQLRSSEQRRWVTHRMGFVDVLIQSIYIRTGRRNSD
jgi:hypothetical protein